MDRTRAPGASIPAAGIRYLGQPQAAPDAAGEHSQGSQEHLRGSHAGESQIQAHRLPAAGIASRSSLPGRAQDTAASVLGAGREQGDWAAYKAQSAERCYHRCAQSSISCAAVRKCHPPLLPLCAGQPPSRLGTHIRAGRWCRQAWGLTGLSGDPARRALLALVDAAVLAHHHQSDRPQLQMHLLQLRCT